MACCFSDVDEYDAPARCSRLFSEYLQVTKEEEALVEEKVDSSKKLWSDDKAEEGNCVLPRPQECFRNSPSLESSTWEWQQRLSPVRQDILSGLTSPANSATLSESFWKREALSNITGLDLGDEETCFELPNESAPYKIDLTMNIDRRSGRITFLLPDGSPAGEKVFTCLAALQHFSDG